MRIRPLGPVSSPVLLGLLATAAMAPAATAQSLQSDSPWYLELGAGFTNASDSPGVASSDGIGYDEGYMLRVGLGRHLFNLRDDGRLSVNGEIELMQVHNNISQSDFSTILSSDASSMSMTALMFNGLVDWQMSPTTSFEFGVGIGIATGIDFQTEGNQFGEFQNDEDTAMLGQVRLGFTYKLGGYDNHRFDFGYRYLASEDISMTEDQIGTNFDIEYGVHIIELGMRWEIF